MPVGQHLDLDVARPLDVPLGEDAAVAEPRLRLAGGRLERLLELSGRADDPHAPPAAAGRRLDDQRVAELLRLAGLDDRDTRLAREPLGLELVPGGAKRRRRRADEDDAGPRTASAKSPLSARKP